MKPNLYLSLSVLIFLIAGGGISFAQAPPILWQRCYGGDSTDHINCVKQTPDGGYIATGSTRSANGDLESNGGVKGLWVLKLDPWGNIQWERTYSDTIISGYYIEPTMEGGYILTTNKQTIKLHNDGSVAWIYNLYASTAHQTSDSGYIICSPSVLIKLNPDGSIAWQQGFYPSIVDACASYSGGYMVSGCSEDTYVMPEVYKTNDTGGTISFENFDYTHGSGLEICRTNDNNTFIWSYVSNNTIEIAKIDNNCNLAWKVKLLSLINYSGYFGIAATLENGALAIHSDSGNVPHISVTKYDIMGKPDWNKKLGGSKADYGISCFQAANGNYLAAGYTYSNDGDVIGNHGDADGWIVVFGTNVGVKAITNLPQEVQVYPIPAKDQLYVDLPPGLDNSTIKLADVMGKTLLVKEEINGLLRIVYLGVLPAGEYLLQIENNGSVFSKKIVHY